MSLKLRDLIRQVRACKTAGEERAVIAKESAMIRTAIREEQVHYRHRNVAKLLFIHMLGYPTHFGQLECMKLVSSPNFPEKRIGYLGMMLLLSEEADVLMLATNALKNDLTNENKFINGLALCSIGNLATSDMSRDLAPEVDKHLKSNQAYLRKKACLAMARCLAKCPDMVEDFVERVVTLLKDRNHGVLVTVVQLMTQVLIMDQKNKEEEGIGANEDSPCQNSFLRLVPSLVKLLRNLISASGYSAGDREGSADTFLQVQILTLLRLLGTGNEEASEEMNDVLAQVATNTETAKNSGNAILYECVQTIMAIESEDSLRVLAVNILGRFLLNRDNNIRYVALNTLSKCIIQQKEASDELIDPNEGPNSASSALQRHRTTVVDCLKDPDISIRQRALELIYHLVNKENVEGLIAELLNYLVLCPREHRADICSRILRVVEKFSPDDRWRIDTLITMLTIAGRQCERNIQSNTIIFISRSSEDLHAYATHKLMKAIRDDDGTQHGLLNVGIWCIGEYGDLLLKPYTYNPSASAQLEDLTSPKIGESLVSMSFMALDPSAVVNTVENVTTRHNCPEIVKHRALTCFVKLSDRFSNSNDSETLSKIHALIKKHSGSHSLELQLRSCEYDALVNAMKGIPINNSTAGDDIFGSMDTGTVSKSITAAAKEALARMPVVDLNLIKQKRVTDLADGLKSDNDYENKGEVAVASATGGDLLDLADIFGGNEGINSVENTNGHKLEAADSGGMLSSDTGKSDTDLLSDIFSAPPVSTSSVPNSSSGIDMFSSVQTQQSMPTVDLFGTSTHSTPAVETQNTSLPDDLFGAQPTKQHPNLSEPHVLSASPVVNSASFMTPTSPAPGPLIVPGFAHGGLKVEFECTKPDASNKQNSTLIARFINTTSAEIYGLSLQCAVPKYITMTMKPPTSTTVPVTGSSNTTSVTQIISVTNSALGQKKLMLRLKAAFTANGTEVGHVATCSDFPNGEY